MNKLSQKFNRLESIKFDKENGNPEEDLRKSNDNVAIQNQNTLENNFKNDQKSKISNVNILHLLTSYRFVMNCILATMQNALFILMLQILVPYLTSTPYEMSLGEVSLIMSVGTCSILINAVVM